MLVWQSLPWGWAEGAPSPVCSRHCRDIEDSYRFVFVLLGNKPMLRFERHNGGPVHGNPSAPLFLRGSSRRKLHSRRGTDRYHSTLVVPANPCAGKADR